MKKIFLMILFVLAISIFPVSTIFALDIECENVETYKGEVIDFVEQTCEGVENEVCIAYTVEITEGDFKGEIVEIQPMSTAYGYSKYSEGDKVYISGICGAENEILWGIESYSRESSIFFLLGIFVLIVFLVSGRKGLGSILGLVLSFFVIYFLMIPMSTSTGNVLFWGAVSILLVLISSIYLSHGFNKKSNIALVCTFIGLIIVSFLSLVFINSTKLTGFGNEEVYMLLSQLEGGIPVKEILYVSILISGIGVLDDVTVSQVGAVIELSKANPDMGPGQLFRSSMNIGKDHVASMVNTLFIAYAGSSLSLIMLMNANGTNWYEILNGEFFAEEIVRAVISSMGLVLIVPITAYISSIFVPSLVKRGKV